MSRVDRINPYDRLERRRPSGRGFYRKKSKRSFMPDFRLADTPQERYRELRRRILKAETVASLNVVLEDVNAVKGKINETQYDKLRKLAAGRMDEVAAKERTLKLGPLGEIGGRKEGAL